MPTPALEPTTTRIHRSAAPVIRRQLLEDAGLHTKWGLAITKTAGADTADATRPITEQQELAGGKLGRIYGDTTALAKAANKQAALQAAAARAGDVGQLMQKWAKDNWLTIRTEKEKQEKQKFEAKRIFNLGGVGEAKKLDPWIHKVVVPYAGDGGDQTLTMEFQHTKGFDGYVCKVSDTGNADLNKERPGRPRANSRGAAMYMGQISASAPSLRDDADFSNIHDQTAKSAGKNLLALTEGADHVAADSYTKLAGEGARFVCVRDNMDKLQNDSYFYYEDKGTKYGITFAKLWVKWEASFGKAYNISNKAIVDKMKKSATLRTELLAVDPAKDVKLG